MWLTKYYRHYQEKSNFALSISDIDNRQGVDAAKQIFVEIVDVIDDNTTCHNDV